jgi:hypothetical protein
MGGASEDMVGEVGGGSKNVQRSTGAVCQLSHSVAATLLLPRDEKQ